jgi:RNA polymerase sigma factor for flagellar operon FliA
MPTGQQGDERTSFTGTPRFDKQRADGDSTGGGAVGGFVAMTSYIEDAMTFTQAGYVLENDARNQLILSELSRVYYLARRIHERLPQHLPLEDLVHAGVLGLIEAVSKYNPNKNASLAKFASFRIRGAILDSLRALDWGSRPLRKKGRNVAESITKLANKLGRQPDQDEIAADLDLEVSELHTLLRRLDGLHIVGQIVGPRFGSETQDLIESAPADEKESPFELCLRSERSDFLTQAIETLSEKEQMLISLYYREELTMREVAEVMDLTESRVSQIHSLVTAKLRAAIQKMQLEEDTFR